MKLDRLYSKWANRQPFFYEGWGRRDIIDDLLKLGARKVNRNLAGRKLAAPRISWTPGRVLKDAIVREGVFESPFYYDWKPGRKKQTEILPPEIAFARLQLILPRRRTGDWRPLVLHFAATGDEGFGRRSRALARPLARQGIASAILENPYYGQRRPPGQPDSRPRTVTEFLQMSRAAQDEGLVLLEHFRRAGFGPLGVTGVSMGGYIALVTAAQVDFPLAVAACIPCHSAAPVWTTGVLGDSVDWSTLAAGLNGRGKDPREHLFDLLDLSDLCHLPVPPAADRAILIGATDDEYIPPASVRAAHEHWTGSELRWIKGDHVGSFLFHLKDFRLATAESLERVRDLPGVPLPSPRSV